MVDSSLRCLKIFSNLSQLFSCFSNSIRTFDFIYVTDVTSAIRLIIDKGVDREIYEVGSGKSVTLSSIFSMLGAKILYVDEPTFHLQVGMGSYYSDISNIWALGWRPKVDIEEGIRRVLND